MFLSWFITFLWPLETDLLLPVILAAGVCIWLHCVYLQRVCLFGCIVCICSPCVELSRIFLSCSELSIQLDAHVALSLLDALIVFRIKYSVSSV